MAEEIVAIRIIPEGVSSGNAGSSGSAGISTSTGGKGSLGIGGAMKGISGAIKGAMSALGIGSVIGIIIQLVSTMKGLMSVVSSIFKMIGFLLKPIADVIMILLMPILMILKPIMILANQVMAPFLKLAMQMMRQGQQMMASGNTAGGMGAFAAAGAIALQGLSAVILAVSAELVKMIITMLGQVLALVVNSLISFGAWLVSPILRLFGMAQEDIDAGVNSMQQGVSQGFLTATQALGTVVDAVAGTGVAVLASQSAMLAETFGVNADEFRVDAVSMMTKVFTGAEGLGPMWDKMIGTGQGFGQTANTSIKEMMGVDGIGGTFTTEMDNFKTKGVNSVRSAVTDINAEWDKLNNAKNNSKKDKGFWETAAEAIMNIGDDTKFLG